MKPKKYIFLILFIFTIGLSSAQVGIGTLTPDISSVLDITSSTQGILLPRITSSERDLIANTAKGLLVYNSDDMAFNTYDTNWNDLSTTYKSVSSTLGITTASIAALLVDGMILVPKAGTYLVHFSSQFNNVSASPIKALASFSIFANGIQISDSVRNLTSLATTAEVELQTIVTVASGQTIEIKCSIDSIANTLLVGNRTLTLTKVK